ncbi:transcriptional repressor LexA [bacterium]|nr:MAG: transcriptional repressor LexA [bacterium]
MFASPGEVCYAVPVGGASVTQKPPTQRQQAILDVIASFTREHGYPPSVREIGERVGLSSSSTVQSHLKTLERRGYVKRDPTKPRALVRDQAPAPEVVTLPVVGRVAAGVPITAVENVEDEFALPASFVRESNAFMLRVQGDSMIDAGILDGDLIVVRPQETAENGEIVVALIEDEATVKTFYREAGRIRLQPQNQTMEPIFAEQVQLVGRVCGVVRKL